MLIGASTCADEGYFLTHCEGLEAIGAMDGVEWTAFEEFVPFTEEYTQLTEQYIDDGADVVIDPSAAGARSYTAPPPTPRTEDELNAQTRQWGMFLHMSLLLGFLIPVLGLVVPILIWQLKRDEFPGIDPHGKNVMNWIISFFIYGVGSAILCMVVIGFPMLMALGVCGIIFPIIGGIKANDGEVWGYPLAIKFLN